MISGNLAQLQVHSGHSISPLSCPIYEYILWDIRESLVQHCQVEKNINYPLRHQGRKSVYEFILVVAVICACQIIQALDDILSRIGAISILHGGLLGYGQIYIAKEILTKGGCNLNWLMVFFIALAAIAVSVYKIHKTGTRWVFAFNFGVLAGIIYGGFDVIHRSAS